MYRLHAFALKYPIELFPGDCDFQFNEDQATNETWALSAPISTCAPDLFTAGIVPESKALVFSIYGRLHSQFQGSISLLYYSGFGCVTLFLALGQGLLGGTITVLLNDPSHAAALLCWMVSTTGVLIGTSMMLAEWSDPRAVASHTPYVHGLAAAGLFGLQIVLWKESVFLAMRKVFDGRQTKFSKSPQHTAFLSLRFGPRHGVEPMAKELQAALAEHGIDGKIIEMDAGAHQLQPNVRDLIARLFAMHPRNLWNPSASIYLFLAPSFLPQLCRWKYQKRSLQRH